LQILQEIIARSAERVLIPSFVVGKKAKRGERKHELEHLFCNPYTEQLEWFLYDVM
jgi:hypothetical protein